MSELDTTVDADIKQACPSLTAEAAFELADVIQAAMEANPGRTWTASELGRKVRAQTPHVGQVLTWMVRNAYASCDDRGAWTRYWAGR